VVMRAHIVKLLTAALVMVAACSNTTVIEDAPVSVPVPNACIWKAQDDTTVVCRPNIDSCKGPAGLDWCQNCTCIDPVLNKRSCTNLPCGGITKCKAEAPLFFDGGCSFKFVCGQSLSYQVTCSSAKCECRSQYDDMVKLGNTTTQDLCKVPADKRVTTLKQACEWPFVLQ
jgi:hypothetical protein